MELNKEELREILEDSARKAGLKVKEPLLKSPEQKESEKEFNEWKAEKTKYQSVKEFETAYELLNCILTTSKYEGLVLLGEGGVGKSLLTLSFVKNLLNPNEWEYSNGYTTPLAFYEFLRENRNKKVVILDDVEGIFSNPLALSILKGALWDSDGKRIVQYSSKSDKVTTPPRFIMKAKIIILCNEIPKENDVSTGAMISRTILYKLSFSFEQKLGICKKFVLSDTELSDTEKEMIINILNALSPATKDFSFRTLRKLITFVQYDKKKAEFLFKETTEIDELKEAYLKSVGLFGAVKEQIAYFFELTGKSRRTFFRLKKQMGAKVSLNQDVALGTELNKGD
jgi:GTPase SAR1 family protein